ALARAGFVRRHVAGIDLFLDGPGAKARDAVHVVFANEKVRDEYTVTAPDVTEAGVSGGFRVLNLEALVRMKLTSVRPKDDVDLKDDLPQFRDLVVLLDKHVDFPGRRERPPGHLPKRGQILLDAVPGGERGHLPGPRGAGNGGRRGHRRSSFARALLASAYPS